MRDRKVAWSCWSRVWKPFFGAARVSSELHSTRTGEVGECSAQDSCAGPPLGSASWHWGSRLVDEPIPSGDSGDARQGDRAASDTELGVVQVVTDDSEQIPKFVAYGRRIAAKDDGGSHDVVISRRSDLAGGGVAHWFLGLVEEGEDVEVCHERGVS